MGQLSVTDMKQFGHQFDKVMQPFLPFIEDDHVLSDTVKKYRHLINHAAAGEPKALAEINSWCIFQRIMELIEEDYDDAMRLDDESPEQSPVTAQLSFNLLELKKSLINFQKNVRNK